MAVYLTFPGGKRKAFTVSYDDGWSQDKKLVELMNKYGIKGTFNLCSGDVKFEEIENPKELYKGHEIAVHGLTHAYFDRVAPQTTTYEIMKDRENLEKVFGSTIRGLAYPYSAYDDSVIPILKNCGIKYGRTADCSGNFNLPTDWYRWHPTWSDGNGFEDLCDKFIQTENISFNQSILFYLYGHSVYTENGNRWEVLEEKFLKLSQQGNIWFATNMEIYDYMSAFQNLDMSVDGRYIYNPTQVTLSLTHSNGDFIHGSVDFELAPGEEIYLDRV